MTEEEKEGKVQEIMNVFASKFDIEDDNRDIIQYKNTIFDVIPLFKANLKITVVFSVLFVLAFISYLSIPSEFLSGTTSGAIDPKTKEFSFSISEFGSIPLFYKISIYAVTDFETFSGKVKLEYKEKTNSKKFSSLSNKKVDSKTRISTELATLFYTSLHSPDTIIFKFDSESSIIGYFIEIHQSKSPLVFADAFAKLLAAVFIGLFLRYLSDKEEFMKANNFAVFILISACFFMRPLSFISYYSSFLNALGVIIGSSFIFCLVYYSLTQVEKVYVRVSPMSANSASFRSIPAIISAVSWAFANISSSSNHGTGLIGWCFALLCMLGFAYNGYLMITQVMKIMKEDVQDKDYALHFLCVVLFCFAVICMTMMWRCGSYEHNIGYSSTDRLIAMLFTFAVVLFSWPVKKIDDNEKLIPAETPETHEAHETPASDTDLVGVLFKE